MISSICVVGLGYIGLPTAAVFADAGIDVLGVDIDPGTVAAVNAGTPHIAEPGLDVMLRRVVEAGKLKATDIPAPADVFIITVPTPFKDAHQPDLSYIQAASAAIAPHLVKGTLILLESTSPVGTTEQMAGWLADHRPDLSFPASHGERSDIRIAHCPERVLPGKILEEVVQNDRVIGGLTRRCSSEAAQLYRKVIRGQCHLTNARTAEMAKLTENAYRDVNIAFANELSLISDRLDIDVWEMIRLANRHPRVNILQPGPGVGGHCIAVDPWFIAASAPEESRLIQMARQINDAKPAWVVDQALALTAGIAEPVIACFGLSFKPNVDDLRESPAVEVTRRLACQGRGPVLAVEPHIDALPSGLEDVELADFDQALDRSDLAVLLVDHDSFLNVPLSRLRDARVLDTRGIW
ncbi:MAG: UDP-N-acetyl-D-mannosamine dehydrogenase [Pseudomonadota bacterium]